VYGGFNTSRSAVALGTLRDDALEVRDRLRVAILERVRHGQALRLAKELRPLLDRRLEAASVKEARNLDAAVAQAASRDELGQRRHGIRPRDDVLSIVLARARARDERLLELVLVRVPQDVVHLHDRALAPREDDFPDVRLALPGDDGRGAPALPLFRDLTERGHFEDAVRIEAELGRVPFQEREAVLRPDEVGLVDRDVRRHVRVVAVDSGVGVEVGLDDAFDQVEVEAVLFMEREALLPPERTRLARARALEPHALQFRRSAAQDDAFDLPVVGLVRVDHDARRRRREEVRRQAVDEVLEAGLTLAVRAPGHERILSALLDDALRQLLRDGVFDPLCIDVHGARRDVPELLLPHHAVALDLRSLINRAQLAGRPEP
jgi:hypothetical protein